MASGCVKGRREEDAALVEALGASSSSGAPCFLCNFSALGCAAFTTQQTVPPIRKFTHHLGTFSVFLLGLSVLLLDHQRWEGSRFTANAKITAYAKIPELNTQPRLRLEREMARQFCWAL